MPPANEYRLLDPMVSADKALIEASDAELQARARLYATAWDYYDGNQPEPLKHALAGFWSRRITDEHRMVYKVEDDALLIAQLRYHY